MCNAASLFSSTSSQIQQSFYNHLKLCGPSALPAISMFSSQCTPSTRRCKLKEPAKQEVTARRTSGDENREGPDKPSRPPKDTVAKNMRRGANGLDGQSVGRPPSPSSFFPQSPPPSSSVSYSASVFHLMLLVLATGTVRGVVA